MSNLIPCGTCGYPLDESERTTLIEHNGKMLKPWIELTEKEVQWIYDNGRTPAGMIEMAEAKLREKNGGKV